jgi:ectoine hydroxylase-related dioxygenase (phytanoyl-CoA dioxygenase family)
VYQSNGYVLDESSSRLGRLEPVPDAERHDRSALQRRLQDDGYLFVRGALDPDDVIDFRRYYFDALAGTGLTGDERDHHGALGVATDPRVLDREELRRRLFREIVPGRAYEAFCIQPAIRNWYAWFLGEEPFLHKRRIIRHIGPGENGIGTATQAHYDLLYLRGGSDRVLSSWVPLGDCPVELGGLTYLEGSHHRVRADEADSTSKRPAASITADLPGLADDHDARWLLADYQAGDMVVHTAHTIHAALDNVDTEGTVRLSTDIRYQRSDDPIDGRWQNFWHDRDGL